MVNAKTMRNANIRVSKVNNTKEGLVEYSFDNIVSNLKAWESEKEIEYFAIEHNDDLDNIHYHIVLKFKNTTRFETIKNKFPFGDIQNSKSVKNSVQYLIHLNSPDKHKYDFKDITTNSTELNKYMLKSKISEELDINHYVDEIINGNIKEYEYTDKIPAIIYTKYSSRIDKAFKFYYDKLSMESNRSIEVEFYYGRGGTGKTLYAKMICDKFKESYCISSSSNDPLQDYRGQDVLILDDLRDDVFKFDDLLKILDNNTKSSINSRYKNKMFIGTRIIITSNIELRDWYKFSNREDINQLHRRIGLMAKFSNKYIEFFNYNALNKKYEFETELSNDCIVPLLEDVKKSKEKRMSRHV